MAAERALASGLLHSLNGSVDPFGRAVRKVDAEVLPSTLLPDSLAFVLGRREMQRERVATVGSPEEHDLRTEPFAAG